MSKLTKYNEDDIQLTAGVLLLVGFLTLVSACIAYVNNSWVALGILGTILVIECGVLLWCMKYLLFDRHLVDLQTEMDRNYVHRARFDAWIDSNTESRMSYNAELSRLKMCASITDEQLKTLTKKFNAVNDHYGITCVYNDATYTIEQQK